MKIWVLGLSLLAVISSNPAVADHHEESAPSVTERRADLAARQAELQMLAEKLAENSMELAALEGLEPAIEARIRKAMVLGGRPMLGIEIGPLTDVDGVVNGVGVRAVNPGGPAEQAGLMSGDTIIEIVGKPLEASSAEEAQRVLIDVISEQEAGKPIELQVLRDNERMAVTVVPVASGIEVFGFSGQHPMNFEFEFDGGMGVPMALPGGVRSFVIDRYMSAAERHWDGVELTELSPGLGKYFAVDHGLLVVRKHDRADALPLMEGDVILKIDDREPSSVDQAMRILRSFDAGESLKIAVMRDKKRRKLTMTVPDSSPASKISQ